LWALLTIAVFFGKHGSLAFLQLLREIVAKRIGASEFSHNADCDVMLEAELVYSGQFDVQDFPSQHHDLEEMWIDNFWTAVSESSPYLFRVLMIHLDKWNYRGR
jgi:hypothetical protein